MERLHGPTDTKCRYYIFDYNLVEPAYLTTTDIRHDLFGFMLTYGD